jgi:hypothetical protein
MLTRFVIDLDGPDAREETLLGGLATLVLHAPDRAAVRRQGLIAAVETGGCPGQIRAWMVPRLWEASRTRDRHLCLGMTLPEIVGELLQAAGLPASYARFEWEREPPPLEAAWQWDESSLAFLARLLAEAGLAYWFDHGEDGERLVLGSPPSSPPLALPAFGERGSFRRRLEADGWGPVLRGEALLPGPDPGVWFSPDPRARPARMASGRHLGDLGDPARPYRFRFTAQERPFPARPAPPHPPLPGALRARIAGTGQTAERDGRGRVRIRLPCGISTGHAVPKGFWVPLAQPLGGPAGGVHLPLRPGAWVMLSVPGGEPARAVITGLMPEPSPGLDGGPARAADMALVAAEGGSGWFDLAFGAHKSVSLGNRVEISAVTRTELIGGIRNELVLGSANTMAVGPAVQFAAQGSIQYVCGRRVEINEAGGCRISRSAGELGIEEYFVGAGVDGACERAWRGIRRHLAWSLLAASATAAFMGLGEELGSSDLPGEGRSLEYLSEGLGVGMALLLLRESWALGRLAAFMGRQRFAGILRVDRQGVDIVASDVRNVTGEDLSISLRCGETGEDYAFARPMDGCQILVRPSELILSAREGAAFTLNPRGATLALSGKERMAFGEQVRISGRQVDLAGSEVIRLSAQGAILLG